MKKANLSTLKFSKHLKKPEVSSTIARFFEIPINRKNLPDFTLELLNELKTNEKLRKATTLTYSRSTQELSQTFFYGDLERKNLLISLDLTFLHCKVSFPLKKEEFLKLVDEIKEKLKKEFAEGDFSIHAKVGFCFKKERKINNFAWICSSGNYSILLCALPLNREKWPPPPEVESIVLPLNARELYKFDFACNNHYVDDSEVFLTFFPRQDPEKTLKKALELIENVAFEKSLAWFPSP